MGRSGYCAIAGVESAAKVPAIAAALIIAANVFVMRRPSLSLCEPLRLRIAAILAAGRQMGT
jgi:hypothetical protein